MLKADFKVIAKIGFEHKGFNITFSDFDFWHLERCDPIFLFLRNYTINGRHERSSFMGRSGLHESSTLRNLYEISPVLESIILKSQVLSSPLGSRFCQES